MPRSYELMKSLRGQGFAAMISGAGPSVLVLGTRADLAVLQDQQIAGFSVRFSEIGAAASIMDASIIDSSDVSGPADQTVMKLPAQVLAL